MDIETIYQYCIAKKGSEETFPFDKTTLVFKVMGKMFAIIGLEQVDKFINLKCDPDYAEELREQYGGIKPGWHMSKKHWNSVYLEEDVEDTKIMELVDHSYELIVTSLPKKKQEELKNL